MVKITDKTKDEVREEQRFSSLLRMAQEVFPGRVLTAGVGIYIGGKDESARITMAAINPAQREIKVENPSESEALMTLAARYEELDGKDSWTLKRNYIVS